MTQIGILSGIFAGADAEFGVTYPVNLEPVIVDSQISKGQLRLAFGTTDFATGPGIDRGGINWNDQLYRVMGTKLCHVSVSGVVTQLGDVGGTGPVTFDYSFDRLAIRSGTKLFYWDNVTLVEVTDIDLGPVIDMIWVDGYFMTTDGTYIIVTELSDPTSIDPLKYGSAEADPDMITGLIKFREEVYALGRYTIQVFQNVGGNGFPFRNVRGATIPYGCVGAMAKCSYGDSFAFVGGRRNEPIGVFLAGNGTATKISTTEIDEILAKVADPSAIILENRVSRDERRLFVHLPDQTLVFLLDATAAAEQEVWYICKSNGPYRIRYAVECYSKHIVGDLNSSKLGAWSAFSDNQFGQQTDWEFSCGMLYNDSKSFIVHSLELVGLPGRQPFGDKSAIFMSVSRDGTSWSNEVSLPMGGFGDRAQRMQWRPHVRIQNYLGVKFRGKGTNGFARLEMEGEALAA